MSKAKDRKRRQRPSRARSRAEAIDRAALAATQTEAAKRAHMDAHDGNPYVWRRYTGPPDQWWITAGLFRPMLLVGQLHPLDELVSLADGHRVCYLIDLWPHRWPGLVELGEAARGATVPA